VAVKAAEAEEPLGLAQVFAEAKVPAGFVLALDDRKTSHSWAADSPGERVGVDHVLQRFRQAHPHYRAITENGVVLIEPAAANVCASVLNRRIGPVRLHGPLHETLNGLFAYFDPEHPTAPPSLMGAGTRVFPTISLTYESASIRHLLNDVAIQANGFVWIIFETRRAPGGETMCKFEYMYRDARASTGWKVAR
jgi:hypothetical protein